MIFTKFVAKLQFLINIFPAKWDYRVTVSFIYPVSINNTNRLIITDTTTSTDINDTKSTDIMIFNNIVDTKSTDITNTKSTDTNYIKMTDILLNLILPTQNQQILRTLY